MSEESTVTALLKAKCPKCHKGNMFEVSNPYNFKRMHEMPEVCSYCNESFNPEPGFYTGAMYVNYGFTIILSGLCYILMEIVLGLPAAVFFGIYIAVLLIIAPLMFRYSRVLYLYLFVRYDKNAIKKL